MYSLYEAVYKTSFVMWRGWIGVCKSADPCYFFGPIRRFRSKSRPRARSTDYWEKREAARSLLKIRIRITELLLLQDLRVQKYSQQPRKF